MRICLRFMGLRGFCRRRGRLAGTLGEIAVEGVADVPEFRLDVSDHALPLHTEFKAVVDGTTGDTRLDEVRARVGRSELTASGSVTRSERGEGAHDGFAVVMEQGRIEDMMALSMKGKPTLMRGALAAKAHFELPPGPVSVSRKMRLAGDVCDYGMRILNNAKMQAADGFDEHAGEGKAEGGECEGCGGGGVVGERTSLRRRMRCWM